MTNINLLPKSLGPKGSILKLANFSQKAAVVMTAIFFIFGLFIGGYLFFLNREIKNSQSRQETLKATIKNLEQTEQKLFLLKDRIAKIKLFYSLADSQTDFQDVGSLLAGNPSVLATKVAVTPGKVTLNGMAQGSQTFGDFLGVLVLSPNYKSINLSSFSFSPEVGYSFGFDLTTK
jgi:Tfp pilus assembly protein PilN